MAGPRDDYQMRTFQKFINDRTKEVKNENKLNLLLSFNSFD